MTDEELTLAIAELQEVVRCRCDEAYRDRGLKDPHCECDSAEAVKVVADHIKALTAKLAKAEAGLREIAAEASVPVHTWKNGINFKKMYEGWRKIAVERIDIARAILAEIKGESHE